MLRYRIVCCALVASLTGSVGRAADKDLRERVRVEVAASQEVFIVGQPVTLTVNVTNRGTEPVQMLQVLVEETEPEIEVYISKDGRDFRKWTMGLLPRADTSRERESLSRGEPRSYLLRVLYDSEQEAHLAFQTPRRYWVKVRFPLTELAPPYERTEIESNTIRFEVRDPQGADASMWRAIRDDSFLALLQTGRADKDTLLKGAALLKSKPNTVYDSPLRWALKKYYDDYTIGQNKLDEYEAALLRSILRIELPLPHPFPEDERLDQIITYELPERTTIDQLCEKISKQVGLELKVHPELHIRSMQGRRVTHPLRELMRHLAAYKAEWVRQGDGYFLRPNQEAGLQDE